VQSKNNNRSLFLYTALIFIAAILIIIVAFFGQKNLDQTRVPVKQPENTVTDGISQRASEISEQNALLITQNETLTTLNNELMNDKKTLEDRNKELEINNANGNLLCTVYQYINDKKLDDAKEVLSTINADALTDAQKLIYNNIKKILY